MSNRELIFDIIHFSGYNMPQASPPNCKYSYSHHDQKELSQAIDIHDIFIANSRVLVVISYVGTLLLVASSCYLLLVKEKLSVGSTWSIFVVIIFAKLMQNKHVKKESVVIMPEFGVQLETHYRSGKISRRFVPIGKILRPVLNECVTPITCYWSLALILREEEQLLIVFEVNMWFGKIKSNYGATYNVPKKKLESSLQEVQPPLKMLVPVWKALCAATDCKEASSSCG